MLTAVQGFESVGTDTINDITPLMKQLSSNCGPGPFYLSPGRTGGYAIRSGSTGQDQWVGLPMNATTTTVYLGFAIKFSGSAPVALLYFYGPGGYLASLQWGTYTAGELTFYNSAGARLGTTSSSGLTPAGNVWKYVEVKVVCGTSSSGSVEIKVNGVTRMSVSNVTTSVGADPRYTWMNLSATSTFLVDDMYVCDSSGSINNTFLGPQVVIGLMPSADTDTLEWTSPAIGDHYALVGERACDGDRSYIESGTTGDTDLFYYDELSMIGTIAGIQVNNTLRSTTSANFTIQTPVISGEEISTDAGILTAATTNYLNSTIYRIIETDPATSAPWTREGLKAAQIGVKVG